MAPKRTRESSSFALAPRGVERRARRAAIGLALVLVWCVCFAGGCRPRSRTNVVRLGYFPNLSHAQAVLAVASGELAAELGDVKLETMLFNAGPSLMEALLAGEIDIGYIGPGPALAGHERTRGRAFKVVAGASANGATIVASKASNVVTLDDLKGKRIATPQLGNTQDISARHFVKSRFGSVEASKLVPIPLAEQAAMLSRGQIDAAWVPSPWGERLVMENGARLLAEEKDLWPERKFSLALVVATNEMIATRRDQLLKVLGVHRRWTARLQNDPQAHVATLATALAKLTGKKLPEGVLPGAIAHVTYTDDPLPATLVTMSQWSHELGYARRDLDPTTLVDDSLLPVATR